MNVSHCRFIKLRLPSQSMGHGIMQLNISAISVVKPHLSPPPHPQSPSAPFAYVCCQGRCSRFAEGWCQAVIITLLLLQNLKCGQLWLHCCLRDVPGFGLLPQNPCLCISFPPLFLTYPCVSPCVSLLPHCADKQPGVMAAEEVTCGILCGVLFANAGHVSLSLPRSFSLSLRLGGGS